MDENPEPVRSVGRMEQAGGNAARAAHCKPPPSGNLGYSLQTR